VVWQFTRHSIAKRNPEYITAARIDG